MLLIEIALAIVAWRRGWKGLALIPLAGAFLYGIAVGAMFAASGGKVANLDTATFIIGDILAVAALAVMSATGRKRPEHQDI